VTNTGTGTVGDIDSVATSQNDSSVGASTKRTKTEVRKERRRRAEERKRNPVQVAAEIAQKAGENNSQDGLGQESVEKQTQEDTLPPSPTLSIARTSDIQPPTTESGSAYLSGE
jgi:hypothetical protein